MREETIYAASVYMVKSDANYKLLLTMCKRSKHHIINFLYVGIKLEGSNFRAAQ